MYDILDQIGVVWKKQEPFGGYVSDAYLPEHQIVIEADGVYYHGHPNESPYDERQERGIVTDRQKDEYLVGRGIRVVRIWGSTLKTEQDRVESVLRAIVDGDRDVDHGRHLSGTEPSSVSDTGE